jgi:hypothetical protein
MDISPFLLYFKQFLLKKRSLIDFPFLFFSSLSILSLVYAVIYAWEILYFIGWGFIILSLIWLFIYIFISEYFYSEEYRRATQQRIRKKVEDIKPMTGPQLWAYLKELDERVKAIERITPFRLGMYALAFSILFAVILSILPAFP